MFILDHKENSDCIIPNKLMKIPPYFLMKKNLISN